MNLLFQNNQFKSSLRSYKPLPKTKKPKKPKISEMKLKPVEESGGEVIDLNDKRFDLSQPPPFVKKGPAESTCNCNLSI